MVYDYLLPTYSVAVHHDGTHVESELNSLVLVNHKLKDEATTYYSIRSVPLAPTLLDFVRVPMPIMARVSIMDIDNIVWVKQLHNWSPDFLDMPLLKKIRGRVRNLDLGAHAFDIMWQDEAQPPILQKLFYPEPVLEPKPSDRTQTTITRWRYSLDLPRIRYNESLSAGCPSLHNIFDNLRMAVKAAKSAGRDIDFHLAGTGITTRPLWYATPHTYCGPWPAGKMRQQECRTWEFVIDVASHSVLSMHVVGKRAVKG